MLRLMNGDAWMGGFDELTKRINWVEILGRLPNPNPPKKAARVQRVTCFPN